MKYYITNLYFILALLFDWELMVGVNKNPWR